MWAQLQQKLEWKTDLLRKRMYLSRHRQRLKADRLSFLSNNCLGGILSKDLGLQQASPFVNSWMPAPCFLELLRDLDSLPTARLEFAQRSRYFSEAPAYPLGLWKNREIHFIHSSSREEVESTFYRRLARFVPDRVAVVFSEVGYCSESVVRSILDWQGPPKLCFTTRSYTPSCVVLPRYRGLAEVGAADALAGYLYSCFDLIDWLNRHFD